MAPGKCRSTVRGAGILKILVVDDERDLADVTGALLSAHAIANRVVYSGQEGLQAIEQDNDINAVFSDIMMPEMTGLLLAREIKERYPEVKVVLTSGFTSPAILAAHDWSDGFTPKPYKIETVIKLFKCDGESGPQPPCRTRG
ncbi:response regulator [Massilia phosphatilytica]|jgi:CheY-like chemotaxis protein|nr:response regulator [Massilia phosphatilytica]